MQIEKDINKLADLFESNLLDTNRGYNYYIDWSNIDGYKKYEIEIHAMDVLIKKEDDTFFDAFKELIIKLPTIIEIFPYLFALAKSEADKVRKKHLLKVIGSNIDSDDFQTYSFNARNLTTPLTKETIEKYYKFFEQMGLKYLFQTLIEKSTQDYIVGVLVGMESNGRKNRGGTAFELACQPIIEKACDKHNIKLLMQKKFSVLQKFGFDIDEDIANRKADFILYNEKNHKCINIEVNFFNGGGSKPEEIIDSYINRQSDLQRNGIGFALITDGNCWKGTTNQLAKGFRHLNYLMNFTIAKNEMIEKMIIEEFGE